MAKSSAFGPGTGCPRTSLGLAASTPMSQRSSGRLSPIQATRKTSSSFERLFVTVRALPIFKSAEPADHDSFGAFVHLGVIFSKAPDLDQYADGHALAATFANLRLDVNPPKFACVAFHCHLSPKITFAGSLAKPDKLKC